MRTHGWSPNLRTGVALSESQFSFAISELEYDEQFTAIITYDGRHSQPWARVDVNREIVDSIYSNDPDPVPIILSNEGDVYSLHEDEVEWSKIPGAGILSEDAAGFGATHEILLHDQDEFVLGAGRQLYQRGDAEKWATLSADKGFPMGYQPESFEHGVVLPDGSMVICATSAPVGATGDFLADPRYHPDMTPEEIGALMDAQNSEAAGGPDITRLYLYRGGSFERLNVPEGVHIRDIYLDPMARIWIIGVDGLIMRGSAETKIFERMDFHGDTETLISATWFDSALIVASDYGLHRFDGHRLVQIRPKLNDPFRNRNTPTPIKLQTVGGVLFYFDYKLGVCRWDGRSWDWINIPEELLERDFKELMK